MHVLITGASGFAGRHAIREFTAAGHEVTGLDRGKAVGPGEVPEYRHFMVDLADALMVEDAVREVRPDVILHLAGWSHVGESWKFPARVLQANATNAVNLYTAAAGNMPPDGRFLFVSSADVYGPVREEELPLTEESPTHPESPYALSKLSAEMLLQVLRRNFSLPLLIARPFNHIGPGQSPAFVCSSFARQIAEIQQGRRKELVHGNLQTARDFLDVRDVVRAYRLILEKGRDGDLFVVASGESHTIDSIVRRLFEAAGIEPRMRKDPARFRPFDTKELRGCSEFLRERTGWTPERPLEETLRDIFNAACEEVCAEA